MPRFGNQVRPAPPVRPPEPVDDDYEPQFDVDSVPEDNDDEEADDDETEVEVPTCQLCGRRRPKQLLPCRHTFHMRCLLREAFDSGDECDLMSGRFECPTCDKTFKWHGWPRSLPAGAAGELSRIIRSRIDVGELMLRTGSNSPERLQALIGLHIGDGDVLRMLLSTRPEQMEASDFDAMLHQGTDKLFRLMMQRAETLLEPDAEADANKGHHDQAAASPPASAAERRMKFACLKRFSSTDTLPMMVRSFSSRASITKSSMSLASSSTLGSACSQASVMEGTLYNCLRKCPFIPGDVVTLAVNLGDGSKKGEAEVAEVIRRTGQCRIVFDDGGEAMVPHKWLVLVRFFRLF
eukprot:CAMPEP_0197911264 /NCGR_PEP_ID=MMETSP1439-20131203/72518_1 /TAXON_ID=66791 /ORGANISM="Gonyaulax spinifera, Strain CCMP409" /LENGTH=350 /DNA_ID=CAMNT_0043532989 /DNA_START=66 /DNA_END=1118 /DNA_ORIENTATION=-